MGAIAFSKHQPYDSLLHLFRHILKKTSKFRVTGLCVGNSPVTDEFPTQRANSAENVSIWWRHHGNISFGTLAPLLKANVIVLWSNATSV